MTWLIAACSSERWALTWSALALFGAFVMTSPTSTAAQAGQVSPREEARRTRVFARVGQEVITVGDIEDELSRVAPFLRERYQDPTELHAFAMELVDRRLLVREAETQGFHEHGEIRRAIRENLTQRLYRDVTEGLRVTDAEVDAYVDEHSEEFHTPEQRRAALILLGSEMEAESLLQLAREADTAAFVELARQHSTDEESKRRGGDLFYFMRDGHTYGTPRRSARDEVVAGEPGERAGERDVDMAIVEAVFEMEELGSVVGPVPVGNSFAILRLTGRRAESRENMNRRAPQVRATLLSRKRQDAMLTLARDLERDASLEIERGLLQLVEVDNEPGAGFLGCDHGPESGEIEASPESSSE